MNRREQVLSQVSRWLNDFNSLESLLSDKEEYKFGKLVEANKKLSPIQFISQIPDISTRRYWITFRLSLRRYRNDFHYWSRFKAQFKAKVSTQLGINGN